MSEPAEYVDLHTDAGEVGLVRVRRALLSVSDKTEVVTFATCLHADFGVELVSTGGTAEALRAAGLPVKDVAEITGFPEMMDGRVKTLHPNIHGGLLARLPVDENVLRERAITLIDLVCVNLYPFEQTILRPDVTHEEAVKHIDIGGPAMIRSAAKNHARVAVVTRPDTYENVIGHLHAHAGQTTFGFRRGLAAAAFANTTRYDAAISRWFEAEQGDQLRYGENPHQSARLVREETLEASVAHARQLHGKQLGYINLLDGDAAVALVKDYETPACCIVKHATPCGVGAADTAAEAFVNAYEGDPLAAFGGIVAFNTVVDAAAADAVAAINKLLEVIIAEAFTDDALETLRKRWKNVRLLAVGPMFPHGRPRSGEHRHQIVGGVLVQDRDLAQADAEGWVVASSRAPTSEERDALAFNWIACKHAKSNAVVVGGVGRTFGIGGGQTDRVAAAEQAVRKAGSRATGAVAASDAFFPFDDGPRVLLDAGVTAIIQPGGSLRDAETIRLVDERGAAMIFTGRRHFRH